MSRRTIDEIEILQDLISMDRTSERFQRAIMVGFARIIEVLGQIRDRMPLPPTLTKSVANVFSGDKMADNALVMTVGQTSIDTLTPRLADGITPSGGTVSNVVITFSDPSATFVVNADNTVTFTAVAASTGAVSGSSACTVTDTDSAVSNWTIPFTVTVNAVVPPEQLTQSVANVFSTPA